jgi:hypothetical protein
MSSPSPYHYPSATPSSQPFSFTPTPGPLSSASPKVFVSYIPMSSYSASPIGLPTSTQITSNQQTILSRVSDDAFYGIICAIIFVTLYTSIHAVYYYRKYKKEKLRLKRFNDVSGKVHFSLRNVLNPAYPA